MPRRCKNSAPGGSSQIGVAPLLCPPPNLPNNEDSFLRTELFHFFLSSAQPWRLTGEVSLSILVHFFKIVIVTSQLILFGSLSSTRVSYRERAQLAFNHLYLHDWDPQYETLPYPPSTGAYGFYTQARFYEAVGFALHQYNKTEEISLGGYTFIDTNRSLTVCIKQVDSATQTSAMHTIGDSSVVCQIFSIVYISPERISSWEHTKAFLDAHGLDIDFSRFLQLTVNFSLISPPIHHIDWDSSIECFHFDVNICFENSGQSGQVVGNLNSALTEIECNSSTRAQKGDEGGKTRKLHQVVHLVVDLLAFNVCLVSLALCGLSGCQGFRLWRRTQQFFTEYYGIRLRGVFFDFVNRWNFVVIIGDFLILAGSISKLIHNNDILEAYLVLSYLLGLGTFFVWISVLRYVELSSRSHLLLRTINRSVPGLIHFCACGLVLYFAFVFPAWVILGPFHMKFRSFTSTLECLFSLINGDDMYVTFSIIDANKGSNIYLFSRIFLYIFITLFIYAVLNIFVTIIFEAYEEVKEGKEPESDGMAILKRFIAQRNQTNLDNLDPDNECRPSVNATTPTPPVNRMSSSSVTTVTSAGTVEGISMGRHGNNEDWDVGPGGESGGTGNDNVVDLEERQEA